VLGALAGLALVAGGCGELSNAEFRSKVDGICKRAAAEVGKVPPPAADDLAANGRYADQIIPIVRKTHDQLEAVDAPSNRKSGYKTYVDAIDRFSTLLGRRRNAARAGERRIYSALVEQQNTVLQESKAQAALLGFQQCSK
jgi:hypothetical protein